jgi:hypothetical protein
MGQMAPGYSKISVEAVRWSDDADRRLSHLTQHRVILFF